MDLLELHRIECRGTPRAMGHAQGEALRALVARFVAQRLDNLRGYLADRGSGDVDGFLAAGRRCRQIALAWDPEGTAEADAIAEAAGIDPGELFATTNMTDVRDIVLMPAPPDQDEGCSALMVPPGSRGTASSSPRRPGTSTRRTSISSWRCIASRTTARRRGPSRAPAACRSSA